MAGITIYKGHVAGVNSREYSFADRTTGEKIEGTTHTLFLVTADQAEPVAEMRVNDELSVEARKHQGKVVEVRAEPRARDSRVIWHALSIKPAS